MLVLICSLVNTDIISQGDFEEAKLLYERALETREKALGPNHPEVATSLNSFAILLHDQVETSENNRDADYILQGHLDEARTLYERALDIRRNVLGPYHPEVATSLNNLAALLKAQVGISEVAGVTLVAFHRGTSSKPNLFTNTLSA